MRANTRTWAPILLGCLRIVSALLFMQHGAQKLFHYPPGGHNDGPFVLFSLIGLAAILEFFGGLALALGAFTHIIAFVLCGEMAVAYFLVHLPAGLHMDAGPFPVVNQGDLAILFCFTFLYLSAVGPGSSSIDSLRHRQRSKKV